jgi:hypothetical protein
MSGGKHRYEKVFAGVFAVLWAGAAELEPLTVRVLPRVVATNGEPLRLGFQVGMLEGPAEGLRAECFEERGVDAAMRALPGVKVSSDPDTGRPAYAFENTGERPAGVALVASALRRGVGYTVRVTCRHVKGPGVLRFVIAPSDGKTDEETGGCVAVKSGTVEERSFAVKPHRDGDYRCGFRIDPGTEMEFRAFSMVPDDAEAGWNREALTALRKTGAGVMRWPAAEGLVFYNWYDGVGPNALRRAAWPGAQAGDRHDFGTVEFVAFCRLVGAEPVIRVPVFLPGWTDARVPDQAAGVQLAADWVAYCNATNDHPLAALRRRHKHPDALGVKRWELTVPEGGAFSPDALAEMFRTYAAAMKAEDSSIRIDFSRDVRLAPLRDRYVAEVTRRLESGDAAERAYYRGWYETLGVAHAALARLRNGADGAVCAPFFCEQVLNRVPYARNMLAEPGLLMAVVNRFPALTPLAVEGSPTGMEEPFNVQAAWTEDPKVLAVFLYNSGTEKRTVRVDLTALKKRFVFWLSDQVSADIAKPRKEPTVPVTYKQKAGAAITQVVPCECPPASFTRVVVKE